MRNRTFLQIIVVTTFACFSQGASAYQFTPTESEWQRWPGYCQAKYVWTNIGKTSKFADRVGPAAKQELSAWEDAGIRGLHHYCAGTIWLNRAEREQDVTQKKYMLRNAYEETRFTYDRADQQAPQFAYVAAQMASILYKQNEYRRALQLLKSAISAQPGNGLLYSVTAVMQRQEGQLQEAKETLLRGYDSLDGKSAEINYNLGLILLELGEIDDAARYAKLAYEMGFPLQGLRLKLQRLGRM